MTNPVMSQVIDVQVDLLDGRAAVTMRVHCGQEFIFLLPPALGLLTAESLTSVYLQHVHTLGKEAAEAA